MSNGSERAKLDVEAAVAAYVGTFLALSLAELGSLRFGIDLQSDDDFKLIRYGVSDQRTAKTVEFIDLPDEMARLLRLHIALSGLATAAGAWVFPGAILGRPKHPAILSRRVAAILAQECNKRVTAGCLKDLAVVAWLRNDVTDIGGAADMLGHLKDSHIREAFSLVIDEGAYDTFDRGLETAHSARFAGHAG